MLCAAGASGWVSDRLSRRRAILVLSGIVFGVGMAIPLVAPTTAGLFAFAAVQGAALGMHIAVAGALISEVLPGGDEHAGRDLGLANVVVNAGQAIAPGLGAMVVVVTGGYPALFVVAIIAALVSALAATRVGSVR